MTPPEHVDFDNPLTQGMIADLAYLSASEGLGELQDAFEKWWRAASAVDRDHYSQELEVATTLALAMVIAPTGPAAPPLDMSLFKEAPLPEGFTHLRSDDGEWRELPVKGARIKELSGNKEDGFVTMLLELDPGAKFPGHEHHGAEHVYLLDGDLISDGRELAPGDFLRACSDTYHSGLSSKGGCHALIMTAQENYPQRSINIYDRLAKSTRRLFSKLSR